MAFIRKMATDKYAKERSGEMAGIFSGLESLGLGNLAGARLFEKEEEKEKSTGPKKAAEVVLEEKDYIFDKTMECPVCGTKFTTKVMKNSKAKLISSDLDLRQRFEGVDAVKYDAIKCSCGYSALSRYFNTIMPRQIKEIRENICPRVKVTPYSGETYTYEEALERYKLALACAVVKNAKASEKAYICLKSAWLMRGYQEYLQEKGELTEQKKAALYEEEQEYLKNALEGFISARCSENTPIAGMDEYTVDFLLAALAFEIGNYEVSTKMIERIITSPSATGRMKDRARELKKQIAEKTKNA